jgi:hypothetical protein
MKYRGLFHREQKDWNDIARRLFVCETVGASAGWGLHKVVGEHGRCDPQVKALAAFGETSLHATTAEQHRDAPFEPARKRSRRRLRSSFENLTPTLRDFDAKKS